MATGEQCRRVLMVTVRRLNVVFKRRRHPAIRSSRVIFCANVLYIRCAVLAAEMSLVMIPYLGNQTQYQYCLSGALSLVAFPMSVSTRASNNTLTGPRTDFQ